MARCPSCDYPLPEDREKVGARCPTCKDPLYEPPGRVGRPAREGEGQCPVHPGVETVGTCRRCGNYLCEVCRTRWREFILCAACVQRALDAKEAAPELETAQRRQALLSIGLGAGLWGVAIIGAVVGSVLAAAGAAGGNQAGAGLVGGLLVPAAPRPAFLWEGGRRQPDADPLLKASLPTPLVDTATLGTLNEPRALAHLATVLLKPGVMDPVALSIADAANDLGIAVESVRSFRR